MFANRIVYTLPLLFPSQNITVPHLSPLASFVPSPFSSQAPIVFMCLRFT